MDASFSSFLRAEEKDRLGSGGVPQRTLHYSRPLARGSKFRKEGRGTLQKGVWGMSNPDMYLSLVMTGTCPLSGGVPLEGTGKAKISA